MVRFFVDKQVCHLAKFFRTEVALEWPLVGVLPFVGFQVTALLERLFAVQTLERSISSVAPQVQPQRWPVDKILLAEVAFKLFVFLVYEQVDAQIVRTF